MENSEDFKWFGEGFDGFPKRLPEDTIVYAVYIIDKALDPSQQRSALRNHLLGIKEFTKDILKNYIWQRESFNLELLFDNDLCTWILKGSTNFGDSIADEWLIVYLLVEASQKYPELWIRLYDNDGEFLLIEAANVLPKWLNPEIATNRVWIHTGEIRLIPLVPQTSFSTNAPSLKDAISFIQTSPQIMTRSASLEKEAYFRIRKYPKAISETFHHSTVLLPRKLAFILRKDPSYLSPAIEAFYLRDPISLKPLFKQGYNGMLFSPNDLVLMSVKFTKVGYAQLKSQEFPIPASWAANMKSFEASNFEKAMIGMKLTCGFEILLSDKLHQNKRATREIKILLEDLENGDDDLPDDNTLQKWSQRDDDETWMNIDFKDFDQELSGNHTDGFGDKSTQESLQKMVSRFQNFLDDDEAGIQGAELDDDFDDDDADTTDSNETNDNDEEEVNRPIEFDDDEFIQQMKEMMGMPKEEPLNEHDRIQEDQEAIESELKEAGALHFGHVSNERNALAHDDEDEENKPLDVDFNLVKNMMEAFKSQGGSSGPAGNMLGLMGVHLPQDDDGKDDDSS